MPKRKSASEVAWGASRNSSDKDGKVGKRTTPQFTTSSLKRKEDELEELDEDTRKRNRARVDKLLAENEHYVSLAETWVHKQLECEKELDDNEKLGCTYTTYVELANKYTLARLYDVLGPLNVIFMLLLKFSQLRGVRWAQFITWSTNSNEHEKLPRGKVDKVVKLDMGGFGAKSSTKPSEGVNVHRLRLTTSNDAHRNPMKPCELH